MSEASIEIGGLAFELGRKPLRCGLHGDPIEEGRCATCDATIAAFEERRSQRCSCGHRRDSHSESAGLCWVGYGRPGPFCECMIFVLAEPEAEA